jgi:hypothetical protein
VLELDYQRSLPSGGVRSTRPVGAIYVGPVRWQVGLAPVDVAFDLDGSATWEQRWGWQRGLATLRPALSTSAVTRWFFADSRPAPEPEVDAALVGWHDLDPLRLTVVPRPAALLAGSLAVLLVGLAALYFGRSRGLAAAVVALSASGLLTAALWPQAVGQAVSVSLPGIAVLVVVAVVQGYLQRRYERRVVFMPGFARKSMPGSSVARNGLPVHREPTTIDAPPA